MSNRRIFRPNHTEGFQNKINLLLILTLILTISLACGSSGEKYASKIGETTEGDSKQQNLPKRIESYTLRGFKFSYYLVPKNLSHDELISTAQTIHNGESDAQLILIDDDSMLNDYVTYSKEISKGNNDVKQPKEWADEHIVGNVQKYLSGKWMLCEGNGYREITELK
jgi:serine protease inhibitor ecotin